MYEMCIIECLRYVLLCISSWWLIFRIANREANIHLGDLPNASVCTCI